MIDFLIIGSIVGAIASATGGCMVHIYRVERRQHLALTGAEALERKLTPALPPPLNLGNCDVGEVKALAYPLAPTTTPTTTPTVITQPIPQRDTRKDELLALISQPNYRYLKRLLNPSAVLVKGPQGSGKSEFVIFLVLLRALLSEHTIEVSDPHAHLNPWPDFLTVNGTGKKYAAINQRLSRFRQRITAKYQPGFKFEKGHTSVWDEVTQYAEECDEKLASTFLKSCLSDTRKIKEHPILISHTDTLTGLGGSKGTNKMKEEGLITLHLGARSNPETGLPEPTLKGSLKSLSESDNGKLVEEAIETAHWMRGCWLLAHFPELRDLDLTIDDSEFEEEVETSLPQLSAPYSQLSESQSRLAFMFSLPSEPPQHEQGLPPHLRAIIDYAKTQGGCVSVRQVQQRKLIEIVRLETNKSEAIQDYFRELKCRKLATLSGEDGGMMLALATNE